MDKRALVEKILEKLEKDLATLTQAALAAYEGATHAESKQEDQYDTRGLEASYLAGAQSRRADDIRALITQLRYLDLKAFSSQDTISSTALIELGCDGKRSLYFLLPKGGGISVEFDGKTVQLLTPQSPLGEALLGKQAGDSVDVDILNVTKEYEVLSVS